MRLQTHFRAPIRTVLATALVCAIAASGCSSGDEGGEAAAGPPPASDLNRSFEAADPIEVTPLDAPNTESGDIRWDASVIRVSEADAAALVERAEEGEQIVMRWQKDAATRLGLEVGKVVLVPGVGLFKIEATSDAADLVEVRARPAELGEAAEYADLDFDRTIGFGAAEPSETGGLATKSLILPSAVKLKLGGGVEIEVDMKKSGEDVTLEGSIQAANEAGASISAKITVKVARFRARGHVRVRGRKTEAFQLSLGHLNLTGSMDLTAESKFEINSDDLKKVPLEVKIPVPVHGIPFFVKVGGSVSVAVAQEKSSKLQVRGEFGVTGASEVRKEGGEAVVRRNLNERLDMTKQSVQDARFGVAVDFPRVGVGIGNDLASAELSLSHVWEIGRGLAYVRSTPDQAITSANSCFKLQVATGQVLKGKISFLALSVSKKKSLWSSERVLARRGDKCDFFEKR